jgi:4-amino-4-deoxy-L-arabinose transferase-like glycosyltransferase
MYEIKYNKVYYLILVAVFAIGTFVRGINIIHYKYILLDGIFYVAQSASIISTNKFFFFQDPPTFSVLISLFNRLNIFSPSLGSFINFLSGSLSIMFIFIVVLLYFRNYKAAIISSILLCFSILHYEISIIAVLPFGVSIFLLLLGLIFLRLALLDNKKRNYIALGLCLGLAAQSYYVELAVVPAVLLYLLLKKGLRFAIKSKFIILILSILILIIPFVLLQQSTKNEFFGNYFPNPDDSLSCGWYKNKCSLYGLNNLFTTFEVYQKTIIKEPFFVLNNHDGNLMQYLTFIFIGKGRVFKDISNIKDLNPDNFSDKTNFLFFLNLLFLVFVLIFAKKNRKEVILFVLIFLFLLSGYSMYYTRNHLYAGEIEIIGLIPLVSLGIVMFSNKMFKSHSLRLFFIVLVVLLLIFPFFSDNIVKKTFETSIFNGKNKGNSVEFWKSCSSLDINDYQNACIAIYKHLSGK